MTRNFRGNWWLAVSFKLWFDWAIFLSFDISISHCQNSWSVPFRHIWLFLFIAHQCFTFEFDVTSCMSNINDNFVFRETSCIHVSRLHYATPVTLPLLSVGFLIPHGWFPLGGWECGLITWQDCFLKKEAEGTLAALEFLIAWGERLAFALVKFSHVIMKEIC